MPLTMKSLGVVTERFGNGLVRSGLRRCGATKKELELRGTRAVTDADGPSKLNATETSQG